MIFDRQIRQSHSILIDVSGSIYGITLGKNLQINQFILGVEDDYARSKAAGSNSCSVSQTCTNEVNWTATLRGRAGVVMDNTLFFTTGGLAIINGTSKTAPLQQVPQAKTLKGLLVGRKIWCRSGWLCRGANF